jgi:DNA-directed RNA polymerase omega subunit
MSQLPSRTPEIDIDACAEKMGGKMNLILVAAQRARDLRSKDLKGTRDVHKNFATEALLDIQNNVIDKEYCFTHELDEEE